MKYVIFFVMSILTPVSAQDTCVVSRRLPDFAFKISADSQAPTFHIHTASQNEGGSCRMRRLRTISDQIPSDTSVQSCTQNSTTVSCLTLKQEYTEASSSFVAWHHFESQENKPKSFQYLHRNNKRVKCNQCDAKQDFFVSDSFLHRHSIPLSTLSPLSVGLPIRLSTERMLAAYAHDKICGLAEPCAAVSNSAFTWTKGFFLQSLLSQTHVAVASSNTSVIEERLWQREWMFCSSEQCTGQVAQSLWLNPVTRKEACAAEMTKVSINTQTPVVFCLLSTKTDKLCQRLTKWREDVRAILCKASGKCPQQYFFYSPTMFDVQNQEFVSSTVRQFYADTKRCTVDVEYEDMIEATQRESNIDSMNHCAANYLHFIKNLLWEIRNLAQTFLRIAFRAFQVIIEFFNMICSLLIPVANNLKNGMTRLLRAINYLMDEIGFFLEQLALAIRRLLTSRGFGKTFWRLFVVICKALRWIQNNIIRKFVCPLWKLTFHLIKLMLSFIEGLASFINSIRKGASGVVSNFFDTIGFEEVGDFMDEVSEGISSGMNPMTWINAIATGKIEPGSTDWWGGIIRTLSQLLKSHEEIVCREWTQDCPCEDDTYGGTCLEDSDSNDQAALPVTTRCWSTYVPYFGDTQQLSCTRADTCRRSLTDSRPIACVSCPEQSNSAFEHFGCDELTKLCTCGVMKLQSQMCMTNADCQTDNVVDTLPVCQLLNTDNELSTGFIPCAQCLTRQVCYVNRGESTGTCACTHTENYFQTCASSETGASMRLHPDKLCIFDTLYARTQSDTVLFADALVTACMTLDPVQLICSHMADLNVNYVRGFKVIGRRLLSEHTEDFDDKALLESTVDALCLDAYNSPYLPRVARQCKEHLKQSMQTLKLTRLDTFLKPCAFCSVADFSHTLGSHPELLLHLLQYPQNVWIILQRHVFNNDASKLSSAFMQAYVGIIELLKHDNMANFIHIELRNDTITVASRNERVISTQIINILQQFFRHLHATHKHHKRLRSNRHLLFWREIIESTQNNIQNAWEESDSLHKDFSTHISQSVNYEYAANADPDVIVDTWPPLNLDDDQEVCSDLNTLLTIFNRTFVGIFTGMKTLGSDRDSIQSMPAANLSAAWPKLKRTSASEYAVPQDVLEQEPTDWFSKWTSKGLKVILEAFGIYVSDAYDIVYSIMFAAKESTKCDYEAMQSCSRYHATQWQGFIIVSIWLSLISFILTALQVGSIITLFYRVAFILILYQLCFGYTWRCGPMIPICWWQDMYETWLVLLPRQIRIPDALINDEKEECLGFVGNQDPSYPPYSCLLSCRDSPFEQTSWYDPVQWFALEISPTAKKWVSDNIDLIPEWTGFDHVTFKQKFSIREYDYENAVNNNSAQRLCAFLSLYMLFPYMIIISLIFSYFVVFVQLLTVQIFPALLAITSIFAAVTIEDNDT